MWDTESHTHCDYHKAIKMEKHWGSHAGLVGVDFGTFYFQKACELLISSEWTSGKINSTSRKQNTRNFLKMEKSELERFSCYFTKAFWLMS